MRKRVQTRQARPSIAIAPQRLAWWPIVAIALLACMAYANTLHNPLVFDDQETILENQQIRDLGAIASVLMPQRELPTAGRPVVNLTFAINYAMGGVDVVGYHVWNVATHLICALLLFGILRRTLALQSGWLRSEANGLACAAALLFVAHPLNTEAVDYLTQRTEVMMAAMLLLTLYGSIRSLAPERRRAWTIVAIVACALGMGSKESMVTAPVLVVLYDRAFAFRSFPEAWTARKTLYLGLGATWAILGALLSTGPRFHTAGFGTGVSPTEYLIDQLPILCRYLWLVVFPHALVHNYGWPQPLPLSRVWLYGVVIAGLLILTAAVYRRSPKLGFLGAWVWITLSPTSSIVPIATEVGAERRMYVPMMAMATLAVLAGAWALKRFGRTTQLAVLGAAVVALVAGTVARNADYSSPLVLAKKTLDRYPTPVAHHVYGTELIAAGRRDDAIQQLRLALPGAPRAHYSLGVELLEEGRTDEGIQELRTFIQEFPYLALAADARDYIGRAYAQHGQWPAAIAEFRSMVAANPGDAHALRMLAAACFSGNDMPCAATEFEKYLAKSPQDADAFNQLGAALASTGRLDDAVVALTRGEQLDPYNGPIERNFAYVLYQKRDIPAALDHAKRAAGLEPEDESAQTLVRMLTAISAR